jgi:PAS domain-containing protein
MAPDLVIISQREQQAWYQPWTFVQPWVRGFIGYSPSETVETAEGSGIYVVQLRRQERWQPQIVLPNLVDCDTGAAAPRSCRKRRFPIRASPPMHVARRPGRRPDPERCLRWRSRSQLMQTAHPAPRDRWTGPRQEKGQGGGPEPCSRPFPCVCAYSFSSPFSPAATSGLAIAGLVLGYVRLGEDHALSAFVIAGVIAVLAIFRADHVGLGPVRRKRRQAGGTTGRGDARAGPCGCGRGYRPRACEIPGRSRHGGGGGHLQPDRDAQRHGAGRGPRNRAPLGEKTRLETLLSEVPDGVLFCTPWHAIALYNGHARDILGGSEALGLNRPVRGLLRMAPITQAYERLVAKEQDDDDGGTDVLVTTRNGARMLEARMRLLRLEGQETERPGYVLTLRDVTTDMATHLERTHLLEALLAA